MFGCELGTVFFFLVYDRTFFRLWFMCEKMKSGQPCDTAAVIESIDWGLFEK